MESAMTSLRSSAARSVCVVACAECGRSRCSTASRSVISSASSVGIQRASVGRSRTKSIQMMAHRTDGRPSRMNVCCQPTRSMRNPVMADIHSTVTGLPSISSVLARERSARVNHRVRISSSAGKIMLSATPSRKRSIASIQKTRSTPVSAANVPHTTSAMATRRVQLNRRAATIPGT